MKISIFFGTQPHEMKYVDEVRDLSFTEIADVICTHAWAPGLLASQGSSPLQASLVKKESEGIERKRILSPSSYWLWMWTAAQRWTNAKITLQTINTFSRQQRVIKR